MKHHVRILRRAAADVERVFGWLAKRSPAGAAAWLEAFLLAADDLARDPERFGAAPESARLGAPVRQQFFRTKRGKRYRILFLIVGDDVRVLRVRGPGQLPISDQDLLT